MNAVNNIPHSFVPGGFALVFLALALLALRARSAWIRWAGLALCGLLGLIFGALVIFVVIGENILNTPTTNPGINLSVIRSPAAIARGKQLAMACVQCHSSTGRLPLDGGNTNLMGGGPLGSLYGPNLTDAGPLNDWSDGLTVRALREGVDDEDYPLVNMPSQYYHFMSDADAQAIVAYLRVQPVVQHSVPDRDLGWLAEALIGAGLIPTSVQPPFTDVQTSPPPGPTAEYGQYLVRVFACGSCHGANLAGKKPGGGPAGPNLTRLIPPMEKEAFIKAFREGKDTSTGMPFEEISAGASDDDLTAIYLYLHSLTPLPNN
jgi:cytochrome c553